MFIRSILPIAIVVGSLSAADELDRPPINYSTAKADNIITRLQARIDRGEAKINFADEFGYLPSVLKALNVPTSSQMLVFSKTSLQRDRISPRTPRALYFNDDVYIGFCRLGDVLEVSASDPQLGTVFYSMKQVPQQKPRFERHTENCLICHVSRGHGTPAHLVRSVFSDREGHPVLSEGSYRIDQTSPLRLRWGGWYVTGTHGAQAHLGNLILPRNPRPEDRNNEAGMNVSSLKGRIDTGAYLTPHSDIVALMVLEHQAEMHNRITVANYQTKLAHRDADILNEMDRVPLGKLTDGTSRRVDSAAEQLVEYLLFSEETKLTEPIAGSSKFVDEFADQGPKDKQGRSLRQFDLKTRMFRYPCSYLIYSEAFDALPTTVKERTYRRLWNVLTSADLPAAEAKKYEHLSPADRQAIREILLDTKKGLPEYWSAK